MDTLLPTSSPVPKTKSRKQIIRSSCEECTHHNLGCPRQRPRCTNCARSNSRCLYTSSRSQRKRKQLGRQSSTEGNLPVSASNLKERHSAIWPLSLSGSDIGAHVVSPIQIDVPNQLLQRIINSADHSSPLSLHEGYPAAMTQPVYPSWELSNDTSQDVCSEDWYKSIAAWMPDFEELYEQSNAQPRDWLFPSLSRSTAAVSRSELSNCHSRRQVPNSLPATNHNLSNSLDTAELLQLQLLHENQQVEQLMTSEICNHHVQKVLEDLGQPSKSYLYVDNNNLLSPPVAGPGIDSVLAKTDAAITQVAAILDCRCLTHSNVLSTLIMIIYQAIAWYDTIASLTKLAARTSAYHLPPLRFGDYKLGGAEAEQMLTQLILARLDRVRSLLRGLEE